MKKTYSDPEVLRAVVAFIGVLMSTYTVPQRRKIAEALYKRIDDFRVEDTRPKHLSPHQASKIADFLTLIVCEVSEKTSE